jgi:Uma2 family endonuclease
LFQGGIVTALKRYLFTDEQWHEIQVLGLIPDVDSLALRHGEIVRPSGGAAPVAERVAFSPDDVLRLMNRGIFNDGRRVELLDGELWEKMGQGPRHDWALLWLTRMLRACEPAGFTLVSQTPVRNQRSLPEPDLMLARGDVAALSGRVFRGEMLALAIEIADSSHDRDYRLKAARYAAAEIPEYWVVDIPRETLVMLAYPTDGEYTSLRHARPPTVVAPLAAPSAVVDLGFLFGELHKVEQPGPEPE